MKKTLAALAIAACTASPAVADIETLQSAINGAHRTPAYT